MSYIDFKNPIKVHFTGIGGISMSGFAELLLNRGFTVTGSDWKATPITTRLESLGAKINYGAQTAENVEADTKLLVYTAAVKKDNPELLEAARLGIPAIERGKLVGEVMLYYSHNYSVAGTHGKTTATSMLAITLLEAGLDPTVSVGGVLDAIGGNMRIGASDNMVIESCEYTDSFLNFHPTHAIITNVEAEHLDYFGTEERMRLSYKKFTDLLPADGLLVVHKGIRDYDKLFGEVKCPLITYSESDSTADYSAKDISYNEFGFPCFTLVKGEAELGTVQLSVPGIHNVANAVGVSAMALSAGIEFESIASALSKFHGTGRRFEKKGEYNGVIVIDDYAHHPTEIAATLNAAKRYPHKTLWTIFQPHTYSRTAAFTKEIADALSLSDRVILTEIYAARETNTFNISSEDVAEIIRNKYGKEVYCFSNFDDIVSFVSKNCLPGDLLITMGAGDVVKIGEKLLSL